MNLYTIGFTKKSAEEFFESIKNAHISLLVDVRLNNNSQLSGFAKGRDLAYFLPRLAACKYVQGLRFAPTKELLSNYRKGVVPWGGYEVAYRELCEKRDMANYFRRLLKQENVTDNIVLLCSEYEPTQCHRRLLAEYLAEQLEHIEIHHIV